MRPNEDMQLKKKNRKSETPSKVREQDGQAGKVSVWGCSVVNGLPVGHLSCSLLEYTAFCETLVLFGRMRRLMSFVKKILRRDIASI